MELRTLAASGYCLTDWCTTCSGEATCSGTGYRADANFLDKGYNTFAFLGEEYSSFNLNFGFWQASLDVAKTSDITKAVANRYNLEWGDRNAPNWIGNVIDYIRTYDEEAKRFRVYKPSVTPEDNVNNPHMVITDEINETQLRGLQVLVTSGIELTLDGSLGIIMDFR